VTKERERREGVDKERERFKSKPGWKAGGQELERMAFLKKLKETASVKKWSVLKKWPLLKG